MSHMDSHMDKDFLYSGFVTSSRNVIEICENRNKEDYDTITKFINEINNKKGI